jgi:hypothetical protein
MEYQQFIAPLDSQVLEFLGVEPVAEGDEETTRVIRVELGDGQLLTYSYDVVGGSVRVRWTKAGVIVLDLFREGVVKISVESEGEISRICAFAEFGSLRGVLSVQILPELKFCDQLMIR